MYHSRFLILLALLILLPAAPAFGQRTGTVRGTVTAAASGEELAGVNVYLDDLLAGSATDADGTFVIENIPPGTYTLYARFIGFRTLARSVEIETDETIELALELRIEPVNMTTVQVEALRPDLQPDADLQATQVRESNPRDAGEVLRLLPGVNSARRGPIGLDPNVRGLSESEVGAYVDGVRRFPAGPLRMDSQVSHFDPSVIDRIEVVKGPYALTWGAGNMGAIRVHTKDVSPAAGAVHGYVRSSYESNEQASGHTGALFGAGERITYWGHGAYRSGNDYETGDGRTIPANYSTAEARGKASYSLTDAAQLTLSGGYQYQHDIDYPGRLLDADYFKAGDVSLRYEWSRRTGLLQGMDGLIYWHRVDHRMDNDGKPTAEAGTFPSGMPRPPLAIEVKAEMSSFGGRFESRLKSSSSREMRIGVDFYSAFRDARRPFFAVMNGQRMVPPFYVSDRAWPAVTINDAGLFAKLRQSVGAASLSATVRLDAVVSDAAEPSDVFLENAGNLSESDLRRTNADVSAAGTASWQAHTNWSISAGIGSVVRSPDAMERYSDRFPASKAQMSAEFQGNPYLEPERSTQVDLWIDGTFPGLSLSINAFARHMSNYITLQATEIAPLLPLSPETVFTYVNGSARFVGIEASAAVAIHDRLTASVSSSYLRGRDLEVDEPAFGVSPLRSTIALRYERAGGRFFAQTSAEITAEQTRIAALRGETSTDGYVRGDVRVGYEIIRGLSFLGGIRNVTDTEYVNHLNARSPFSGLPIAEAGRSFFGSLSVTF